MNRFLKGILAFLFLFCCCFVQAQVSSYTFSQSNGTYTPITGGTVIVSASLPDPGADDSAVIDDFMYTAYNLPFPFYFGGSAQTVFRVNSNGWVGFGTGSSTTGSPISSTASVNGVISAVGADLLGLSNTVGTTTTGSNTITAVGNTSFVRVGAPISGSGIPSGTTITGFTTNTITISANATGNNTGTFLSWPTGEIRTNVVGSAPNRSFVIQFSGMVRYASGSSDNINSQLNFQIRLNEGGGDPGAQSVQIVYGPSQYPVGSTTAQVGLRGASNADYNNRSSTTSWTATTAGTSNSSTVTLSNTVLPPSGLTFTFTPPPVCTAPAAQPTALVLNSTVSTVSGSFTAASPAPTGYLVVRTTSNTAPVPVDGTTYTVGSNAIGYIESVGTGTSFTSTGLSGSTTYYYWVFAYNNTSCQQGPKYLTATPLTAPATTTACSLTGTKTIPGDYASLTAAVADLQAKGLAGSVVLELQAGYTGAGESYPIVFGNIACAGPSNTVTLRPAAGATGLLITSANTTATLDLNGAQYLTIDGRPGGTGTAADLKIINTSASGVALRLINDAHHNTLTYLDLQGQNTSSTSSSLSGVVYFSTAVSGGQGNDNNVLSFSNIHATSGGNPTMGISASGSTTNDASYNDNNTITNCNIYDFFSASNASSGIKLDAGNNAWTITGNNVYQTAARVYTSANTHRAFWITPNTGSISTTASGFVITGNFIGGNAPGATGTYTMSGTISSIFNGMDLSVGLGTPTTVQNNIVRGISLSTSSTGNAFVGIGIANGNVDLGTVTGNTIGAASGSSIAVTSSSSGGTVWGVRIGAGNTLNIANNTIGSFSMSGGGTISTNFIGIGTAGGTTINVTGNTINNITAGASSSTTSQSVTGISIANGTTSTVANNTVSNLTNGYTGTGAGLTRGIVVTTSASSITGNTVRSLSSASPTAGVGASSAISGIIMSSTSAAVNVTGNTIHTLTLTGSSTTAAMQITGLFYSGVTNAASTISRNFIHSFDVSPADSNVTLTGIDLATATATVVNNMIRLGIRPDGSSLTQGMTIRGISSNSSSATNNFWFNSIYIGGTGVSNTPTKNSYALIRTTNSGTYDIRDNILVNSRSNAGAGGKHYALFLTGSSAGVTADYNIYNAAGTGGVFAFNGTADVATYTPGWLAGDIHSFYINPAFVAPDAAAAGVDLHIQTGSVAEGTGVNIASVTDDFDGQVRSTLTPTDIGADAGNYGYSAPDVGANALIDPAPNVCTSATQTVTVRVRNFSANPIDLSVNNVTVTVTVTGPVSYTSTTVLNSGTLAPGATVNVTMPTPLNMSANGSYVFNASATVAGDVNGFNNAIPAETRIVQVLGGTYTVGAGGNYTTLTAAVAAYNNATCITSPVVFSLTDASYGSSETFPIVINANAAAGTQTLTIRPAAGVSPVISGSSTSAVLRLNGADYIIIEGSNNGSNSRNLTISNTSTAAGTAAVWLSSNGTGAGATHNIVRNTNLSTGVDPSSNTNETFALLSSGTSIATGNDGADNSSNSFVNNNVTKASWGIYVRGASGNPNTGLVISNNVVGPTAFGANEIGRGGIVIQFQDGAQVTNNEVRFVGRPFTSAVSGSDRVGIGVGGNDGPVPTATTITNTRVTGNNVHDIVEELTFSALGIVVSSSASPSNNVIANNFINNVRANGTVTDQGIGLDIAAGNGDKIVFNTVNMTGGDVDPTGASSASQSNIGIRVVGSSVSNLTLADNISVVDLTSNTSTLKHFAVVVNSTSYAWGTGLSDYNDYYVNPANAQMSLGGIGTTGTITPVTTLASWRTQFTPNQDAHSISVRPIFASPTNLHMDLTLNTAMDNKGTPIAGITTDIDGDVRDASTPDIGADEFTTITGIDLGAKGLAAPAVKSCYSNAETVTVTIKNYSASTHNFALVPVTVNASATGANPVSFAPVVVNTGTLAAGDTLNVVVSTNYDMSALGTYTFQASTTTVSDIDNTNDNMPTVSRTLTAVVAGTVTSSSSALCQSGTPTLTVTGSNGNIQWQESASASGPWTNVGTNSSTYTPATPVTATTYYRAVIGCNANSATTNTVTVTVNNPQVLTTVPATRCGIGTATLQATGTPGTTLQWYASASGGTPLASGGSFTTPSVTSTTTYYVAAENIGTPGSASLGTGSATSSSAPNSPFNGTYGGMKSQYLIRASELIAAGVQPGNLTRLSLQITAAGSTLNGFAVQIGNTALTEFGSPVSIEGGLTTVYGPAAFTPVVGTNTITFSSPFYWNGSSNIIVSMSWSNNNSSNTSSTIAQDPMSYFAAQSYRKDNETAPNLLAFTGATGTGTSTFDRTQSRPAFSFGFTPNCPSSRTAVTVTVTTPPAITLQPTSTAVCAGQSTTLTVSSPNTGYTYNWTPGSQSGASINITPTASAYYVVTATDNSGGANQGCVAKDSVSVTVNPVPTPITVTPASTTICAGTVQQLTATGGEITSTATGSSATLNLAIPDNSPVGVKDSLLLAGIPATAIIDSVVVGFNLNHAFSADAEVSLEAPNGKIINLVADRGGLSALGFVNTRISSNNAAPSLASGSNPFTGTFRADAAAQADVIGTVNTQTFSDLFTIANGYWKIHAYDDAGSDLGTLVNWNIKVSYHAQVTTWSPTTGLYTNSGATAAYTGGLATTVFAKPTVTTNYTVTATTAAGCSATTVVPITLNQPVVITAQPVNRVGCTGGSVTFTVGATGTGLSYQWLKDGNAIPGATGSTLTLSNLSAANVGNYSVTVTGTCPPAVTSNAVSLAVGDDSWTGTSNSDWNNPLNWCGGVPTPTTNVLIPAGTPFQPLINANADANSLVVASGATLTVNANGRLRLYGNLTTTGTFNATAGTIEFRGTTAQNVPALTVANVIMNGSGGIVLGGNMTIGTALTLTNGNITLGASDLVMTGGSSGSVASHIITNGAGRVSNNNVGTATVIFPVGPNATSYNPVWVANGGNIRYTVGVSVGVTPPMLDITKAVNRTWSIVPATNPTAPVSITLQYADADANGVPTNPMQAAVYSLNAWTPVSPFITPSGTAAARTVAFTTTTFGATALANIGGFVIPLAVPNVDNDVTSAQLLPNAVENETVLRVQARRALKIRWSVVDGNGRVVMQFEQKVTAGQNDHSLKLGSLAAGAYQLVGSTEKGRLVPIRLIKL